MSEALRAAGWHQRDGMGSTARRRLLKAVLATGAAILSCGPAVLASPARSGSAAPTVQHPNVVVILVDDMGFSDIGAYGSEIPTPNLDALAAGGVKFTQFYNTARCSPSRAALLTGTYPHQAGLGHLESVAVPGSRGLHGKLDDRVVTIAEVLKGVGYYTGMAGKWHLGISRGVGPWQRGFERSLTSPTGGLYFPDQIPEKNNPHTLMIDGKEYPASAPEIGKGEWYSSDLFVDWDTRFMHEAQAQNKPFFLYLPFVGVHFPLMAPPEDIARFKGKYRAGWDVLREARLARQKQLGLVAQDTVLPPRLPNSYNWDKLSDAAKDRFDTLMAIYAADISRVDRAVGTLVQRLRESGALDNTLILFMADNGGNAESGPDGRSDGTGAIGGPLSNVFVGMNWATLQNTPFQYFKHFTEEGGISTPLIAHWPRGIDPRLDGTWNRTPGHLIDILPTVLAATGAAYPTTFNGHLIVPEQGVSLMPAFSGKPIRREHPIFWEHEGNRAVRDGKWKLVARYRHRWQLYDIEADRTELHDLAPGQSRRVTAMAAAYDRWAKASFVDPWDEAYDNIKPDERRRNWGDRSVPAHPEAMDASD